MATGERLALAFAARHPADAARVLERAEPADAAAVVAKLSPVDAARVIHVMGPTPAGRCTALLETDQLAPVLEELDVAAAASVARRLEPARRDLLLERMTPERRGRLTALLAYPADTAGALADPAVLTLTDDLTVADAQRQLRAAGHHLFQYLYIVDRERRLVGTVAISELMSARPAQPIASLMQRNLVRLDAYTDLATLADHPAWRELDALPVVDGAGRFVGAIKHLTVRRLQTETGRPMLATIVHLTEMYWAGLTGILTSVAPARARGEPDAR